MIRILVADDHPIIRHGLKQILSDEKDLIIAGEAETGNQAIELLKKNEYDILILDINLPDINGLEILSYIKRLKVNVPVLVLSVLPEEQYAIRVIEAGASGYLNKIAASDQLVVAIKKIVAGGNYIKESLSDKLASVVKREKKNILHENLTQREFEVMLMIASGKTIKEIADKLYLSIPTIYANRSKIFEKMNMKSDSELIQYCVKQGIV